MTKSLLNTVLRLTPSIITQLQDEAEEFNFTFDEYVSLLLIAASYGKVAEGMDALYERVDWTWLKEQGLCE